MAASSRVVDLPRNFEKLKRLAVDQGWNIKRTSKNHWQFTPPDKRGEPCYASSTPSDPQWLWAFCRRLKQNGLKGTQDVEKSSKAPDKTEYFTMPMPEPHVEQKTVKQKRVDMKEIILDAMRHQGARWSYPEDIFPRIQVKLPTLNMRALKIAMNGYSYTKTLLKSEEGKYQIPYQFSPEVPLADERLRTIVRTQLPPEPASEEDIKVLEVFLSAMADAERVIKKHIAIERQLGQMKALLGVSSHDSTQGVQKEESPENQPKG